MQVMVGKMAPATETTQLCHVHGVMWCHLSSAGGGDVGWFSNNDREYVGANI